MAGRIDIMNRLQIDAQVETSVGRVHRSIDSVHLDFCFPIEKKILMWVK